MIGEGLILCGSALVELGEPHADTHGVLEELLCAATHTSLLLLLQRLVLERVYAVREASLHQRVVHPQTVTDLELVDHGGHSDIIFLGKILHISQHTLVHL